MFRLNYCSWSSKIAQWANVLATKPEDPSLSPTAYMLEGERDSQLPQVSL